VKIDEICSDCIAKYLPAIYILW